MTANDKITPIAIAAWEARYGGQLDCLLSDLRRIITEYLNFVPAFSAQAGFQSISVLRPDSEKEESATFEIPESDDWALDVVYLSGGSPWRISYYTKNGENGQTGMLFQINGRSRALTGHIEVMSDNAVISMPEWADYNETTRIATVRFSEYALSKQLLQFEDSNLPNYVSVSAVGGARKYVKRTYASCGGDFIRIFVRYPMQVSVIQYFADYVS
jgi:hypothetical protein